MPRHAYLNELSFANRHVPTEYGRLLFERFFRLLREINRQSPGVTVVGHRRLTELSIGDCSIGAWLRDDPDRKRRIRVLQDRAPFDADLEPVAAETADVLEYSHGDQIAIGLGLAAWHDELAVSVDLPPWQTESVALQCHTLLENAPGDVAVETSAVVARNATGPGHLQAHAEWLHRPDTDMPRTPDELWLNRAQWYPNVAFAGRVERQIRGLPASSPALRQVAEKLSALQDGMAHWDGAGRPDWRVNVVPEYEGRHQHCWFEDLDGERRLFELHVRYAPGPNRIHFRLDAPGHRIIVAHVGRKLGI